jgi:IPT/TIG domain
MSPRLTRNPARKAILAAVLAALLAVVLIPGAAHALPIVPTVGGVSPTSGPTSGGTSVNISGTGFLVATSVTFGGVPATTALVNNDFSITATSPFHPGAGIVDVIVSNGNGPSLSVLADHFTYTTTPIVTSISPNFGSIGGGTFVQVTGSGFTNAMIVTFGGVSGTFLNVIDDGRLTVFSPAHLGGGSVFVVVWVNGVPSAGSFASTFTYGGGLTVSGVSPASGPPSGGSIVTLTGAGFSGATAVSFGGVFGTILQVQNDGLMTVQTPAHFSGSVHVNVWVGATASPSTFADIFVYNGGLTIFDVTPASGPTSGGTAVTISGSGFLGAVAVTFGGTTTANFFVQNDNQILAVSPPHSAGTVNVVVWNAITSSLITGSGQFTYTSALAVTGISPSSGPASGGTTVTVSGAGFLNATSVAFGTSTAANMNILSDSQLTVTAPAHAGAGSVHVVVFAGGAGSAAGAADLFTYTAAPASDPPARFAGRVVVNGGVAPTGTGIQAYIGSALCGSSTVFPSGGDTRYVIDVAVADGTHPGCGADGATVTFWVGGSQAQSGAWHNYQLTNLDLVVGTTAPPPPAPPTLSAPAPRPPNTGSFAAGTSDSGSRSWVLFVLLGTAAMVVATGAMAGMRRRTAPVAVAVSAEPPPLPSMDSDDAPVRQRGGGWLAIAGLGAAAIVAGTVIAKRRRK